MRFKVDSMSKKEAKTIFQKFYRTKTVESMNKRGSGIGLFIVNLFVKMHGGRIVVESILNKGSTFKVLLPLK